MKKRTLLISLLLALCVILASCGTNRIEQASEKKEGSGSGSEAAGENAPIVTEVSPTQSEEKGQKDGVAVSAENSAAEVETVPATGKVNPYDYASIGLFTDSGLAPVCQKSDNRFGYINTSGQLAISCVFTDAREFHAGLAAVRREGETKYGFIDTTGKQVIPSVYDGRADFSDDGYAAVMKEEKCGLIDREGNTVIPFEYYYLGYIGNGAIIAASGSKTTSLADGNEFTTGAGYSLINLEGQQITDEKYDSIWKSNEKPFSVQAKKGEKKILLSMEGKVIGEAYDSVSRIALKNDQVGYIVEKDGKRGVINYSSGDMIVPLEYREILYDVNDAAFRVQNPDGLWGYHDYTGMLIAPQFDEMDAFSDGLAAVRDGKKWGYVDKTGSCVIEPQFTSRWPFSDGLAVFAAKDRKYGYIDKTGAVVLEPVYDSAASFSEGLAFVCKDHYANGRHEAEYSYIDHSGNTVFSGIVKKPIRGREDWLMFKGGIAYGESMELENVMYNTKGEVLVTGFDASESTRYDPSTGYGSLTRYVKGKGYSWLVNQNGDTVIPEIPVGNYFRFLTEGDGFFTGVVRHSTLTENEYIYIYDLQGNRIL